jgi:glycosyltransferase involved in cell wall biosynthesis
MKLLFAHDFKLQVDINTQLYYNHAFNYTLWKRYLEVFDEIKVVSRFAKLPKDIKMDQRQLSSGPNVSFEEVPTISDPINMIKNRNKASKVIYDSLREADILIARLPSEIGLLAISIAKKMKKPWAVEVVGHAWDSLWNYGNIQGKVYAPILTLRTRNVVKKAPLALYVTKNYLQSKYPNKGTSFACSDVFLKKTINLPLEKCKEKKKYTIGLIGSMAANYKGIDTALFALSELKKKYDIKFEFRILGEGNSLPFKSLADTLGIKNDVVFSGTLSNGEQVFKWLDELDLYLQPSRTEGLPRALIEAMSRGIPCISTHVGGVPELLPDDCLVEPGNYKKLSNLIYKVLTDTVFRMRLAEVNINKADEYTIDKLNNKRYDFLKSVYNLQKNI